MSKINVVKAKRGRAKGCLTRSLAFSESINDSTTLSMLEIRLDKLTQAWSDFVEQQDILYEFSEEADFVDPEPEFAEYEAKYFQSYSVIKNAINRKKAVDPEPQSVSEEGVSEQGSSTPKSGEIISSKSIHLPKISIPTFYGDYKDWPAFKDLFTGTIDRNASITATQKLWYLKSFLGGDAASLIKHIPCSEPNYVEAWDKLEARYDKKHLIVHSFIQTFLSLPSSSSSNIQFLRKLTDGADEVIRGLNALESVSRDPWLVFILLQKLDHETKQAWAEEVGSKDDYTIDEFLEFLQKRCSCLESCYSLSRSSKPNKRVQDSVRTHLVETKTGCPKCKEDHILPYCKTFIGLGINARRNFVKEKSLCFNCLRHGHASSKCHSNFRCRMCNSRHHSLVHPTQETTSSSSIGSKNQGQPNDYTSQSNQHTTTPVINHHSLESTRRVSTILPTAVVRTRDKQGIYQNIRVLLDTGSQVSFITEQAVQRLGLVRKRSRIPIMGVASTSAGVTNGLVTLNLYSRFNSNNIEFNCYVISKLTSLLPSFSLVNVKTNVPLSMELADPDFDVPGPIDVLIGADKVFDIIQESSHSEAEDIPNCISTIFGWVIAGSCQQISRFEDSSGVRNFCTQLDHTQEFDIERFWRLEEVSSEPSLSVDERKAEEHFAKTHSRSSDGRYIVQLPFKAHLKLNFGESFGVATNRLYSIERRFLSNPDLKAQYTCFLNEYLSLGHMEEIQLNQINQQDSDCYYLPHHAVFKGDSSTTKVRVVFDGSAKSNTKGSTSLNESLLIGPTIQRDIFSICLRCRRHLYTISGDIEKMYRQVWVAQNHTNFQRIVWRKSTEDQVKHYRLLTVTYGTSAAPFLAVRALKQLALDSAETHPRASSIILNDFYVDDVITGADTVDDVVSIRNELVDLLKSAGFNLRKWTTNCWPLFLSLPEEQRELSPIEFEESTAVKVLGLQWCPSKDCFSYRVLLSKSVLCTKRRVLSDASRIYDPRGFLAPVIVAIKILFHDLWREKLNWDEEIPMELAHRWTTIREELPLIESISIPRIMWKNKLKYELHAFCDASLDAYAAVVYCRSVGVDGMVSISLVAAKTKVAPIKVLSLPRLELCGALLLTRLVNKIKISLQDNTVKVFAWTDSSIVLHWLSAPPKKWSVFIANRTSEILSSIPFKTWSHVPSAFNPADVASRGVPPSALASLEIWWRGPSWLSKDTCNWPVSQFSQQDVPVDQLEERKSVKVQVFLSNVNSNNVLETILYESSNWLKSVRVVAYMVRFVSNSRCSVTHRNYQTLSTQEITDAKTRLIKCSQYSLFGKEIDVLKNGKKLPARNKLISLAPYVDHMNLLRVGGRLQHSELSYNEKHPIILCKSHPIAKLIAQYIHKQYLHAGVSLMLALIKQNFHILGCRNLLRKIVHDCVVCFRQRQTSSIQLMGSLPAERVRFSRPFSKVGCDYAGPITLRLARGRNPRYVKAYIALFVCYITKGVHIELVGDLSSNAFLLALDRFVSRRGMPTEIWSDNATNFHGAKRLLGEMYDLLCSQQHNNVVFNHLAKDNIVWKFIPPSAPHFGGLWEAGIRSVKMHLKRVIGNNILTYEEMYTLLAKIESLLNSRPMWHTSDSEPTALTPSHFMIGESYSAVPQPDFSNTVSPKTNWYLLQALMQGFWKRWHQEYLTSLQHRPKWQKLQRNLQIDDIVLLKEPNLPPSKWILGRITQVHPGNDNQCRVVTVHTKFGDYVRPIVKISPLPISERPEPFRGG